VPSPCFAAVRAMGQVESLRPGEARASSQQLIARSQEPTPGAS
jgi:hypothetical protein